MMARLSCQLSQLLQARATHRMKNMADSRLRVSSHLDAEKDAAYSILKVTTSSVPTILNPSKTVSCHEHWPNSTVVALANLIQMSGAAHDKT